MSDSSDTSTSEKSTPAPPASSSGREPSGVQRVLPRLVDQLVRLDELWTAEHRLLRAVLLPMALFLGAGLALLAEYLLRHL